MPVVALPEILALAGLLFAWGMIKFGTGFTEALFKIAETSIGWVPWLGSRAKAPLHAIQKRINNYMNAAALGVESAIGDTWHVLAYLVEQTGQAIWDVNVMAARALYAWEVMLPWKLAQLTAHAASNAAHQARTVFQPVVNNYATYKGVSARRFADLLKRVTILGAAVAVLQHAHAPTIDLPTVRIPSLGKTLDGVKGRLGRLEHRFGRAAFAAAVAGALATLGISWIRKSCAKRTSESFCRTNPELLDILTYGLSLSIGTLSLRQFVKAATSVEDEIVAAVGWSVPELQAAINAAVNQQG